MLSEKHIFPCVSSPPTSISHSNGLFSLEMTTLPPHWKLSSIEPHWRFMDQQVEQNSHQLNFMNKLSFPLFHNQMSTINYMEYNVGAINNIKVTTQIVTRVHSMIRTWTLYIHVSACGSIALGTLILICYGVGECSYHFPLQHAHKHIVHRYKLRASYTQVLYASCNTTKSLRKNHLSIEKKKKKNHFWNQRTNSPVAVYCVILPGSFILWPAPTPTTIHRCDVSSLSGEAAPALIFCVYWGARAGR